MDTAAVTELRDHLLTDGIALGGLILVFLGATIGAYGSYAPDQQRAVRSKYRKRALLALAGLCLSLVAAGTGVIVILGDCTEWIYVGVACLIGAIVLVLIAGVVAFSDIS